MVQGTAWGVVQSAEKQPSNSSLLRLVPPNYANKTGSATLFWYSGSNHGTPTDGPYPMGVGDTAGAPKWSFFDGTAPYGPYNNAWFCVMYDFSASPIPAGTVIGCELTCNRVSRPNDVYNWVEIYAVNQASVWTGGGGTIFLSPSSQVKGTRGPNLAEIGTRATRVGKRTYVAAYQPTLGHTPEVGALAESAVHIIIYAHSDLGLHPTQICVLASTGTAAQGQGAP